MTPIAIAWDIDGTLLDSEPLHYQALLTACEQWDVDMSDVTLDTFCGIHIVDVWTACNRACPQASRTTNGAAGSTTTTLPKVTPCNRSKAPYAASGNSRPWVCARCAYPTPAARRWMPTLKPWACLIASSFPSAWTTSAPENPARNPTPWPASVWACRRSASWPLKTALPEPPRHEPPDCAWPFMIRWQARHSRRTCTLKSWAS